MPQIIVVTGFLGAGKTSLLQAMLREPARSPRTAVIVNEFGEVGIDGAILREGNLDVIELSNGCLCCSLRGSTEAAIEDLLNKPDIERIVIEASGAAAPANLMEILRTMEASGRATVGPHIGVLDTSRYFELDTMLGEFQDSQIRNADLIVLNKTDMARAEDLALVRQRVRAQNSVGLIVSTTHGRLDERYLLPGVGQRSVRTEAEPAHQPTHHPSFRALVLTLERELPNGFVENSFAHPIRGLFRAKGFVKIEGLRFLVQYDGTTVRLSERAGRESSELVFIGQDIDEDEVERRFRGFASRQPLRQLTRRSSGRNLMSRSGAHL